jgi:hypothetical protein
MVRGDHHWSSTAAFALLAMEWVGSHQRLGLSGDSGDPLSERHECIKGEAVGNLVEIRQIRMQMARLTASSQDSTNALSRCGDNIV